MKKNIILTLFIVLFIAICTATYFFISNNTKNIDKKIDDWKFSNDNAKSSYGIFSPFNNKYMIAENAALDSSSELGFSVGGAKDINNFRENIKEGFFPISTDITYNGLFYDYSFNTGKKNESDELFSPSYVTTISKDPISNNEEYYMTVGLNSNIKENDFKRKKLNLVVLLDISGSMSSNFNSYYYDNPFEENIDNSKSKMQLANESVNILLDNLKDEDRFGMILFNNDAYVGKPMSDIKNTDIEKIKEHILEIEAFGGTNFEIGYTKATELFDEYKNIDKQDYENRIIVITDAMPNCGTTSKDGLLKYIDDNSNNGIYTTFIGVGVDFNTEVIEALSDVVGSNYYSVHNSDEFKNKMGDEFEYMVTPLVFDLSLDFVSEDYEIESIYGSDTANKQNGNIIHVNTLFPSKSSNMETKGGVILLKLKPKTENKNGTINLNVSYKDRSGKNLSNSQTMNFMDSIDESNNTGINKAILLIRYANTIKNWILYERSNEDKFLIIKDYGIIDFPFKEEDIVIILGENERKSVKLTVSQNYKEIFKDLKSYIENENNYINDNNLNKELEILDLLINY